MAVDPSFVSGNETRLELKVAGQLLGIDVELTAAMGGHESWVFRGEAYFNQSINALIDKFRGDDDWAGFDPRALPVQAFVDDLVLRYRAEPTLLTVESNVRISIADRLNLQLALLFAKLTAKAPDSSAIVIGVSTRAPISLSAIVGSNSGFIGQFLDGLALQQIGAYYASAEIPALDLTGSRTGEKTTRSFAKGPSFVIRFGTSAAPTDLAFPPATAPRTVAGRPPPGTNGAIVAATPHTPVPTVVTPPAGSKEPMRFWAQLDKTIGPLELRRIGGEYENGKIGLLLDAAVTLVGLRVGLAGLGVKVEPSKLSELTFQDLEFSLDGLEISFTREPVSISGALLKTRDAKGRIGYAGQATIRVGTFSIAAIGAYTTTDDDKPSFFIFGALTGIALGPPCFTVLGIAAGFGYNRAISLPDIDGVRDFPLVSLVLGPSSKRPAAGGSGGGALDNLMASTSMFPPVSGQYWIAAGMQFTSFKLIEGFALLTVQFGARFEIALLGVATLRQPPAPAPLTLVVVELALKVRFAPDDGLLSVLAQLTANSYLFDPSCRLTGGFAFCIWFEPTNPAIENHAGDFVLSLGGYHPKFAVPKHYPKVPRVGFNWSLPEAGVTIKGEAYFALTPSFIMAGALLSAVFRSGDFAAWFEAKADFLIGWAPLYYTAEVSVRLGAAFVLRLGDLTSTLSFELSAWLKIWGPPFAGEAHVDLGIVSFTVPIGEHDKARIPPRLGWNDFVEQFLPNQPLCIIITSGLAEEHTDKQDTVEYIIVNPSELVVAVDAFVPVTTMNGTPLTRINGEPQGQFEQQLGIRPIGQTSLPSRLTWQLTLDSGSDAKGSLDAPITFKNVPEALWSSEKMPPPGAASLQAKVIPQVPMGLQIRPKAPGQSQEILVERKKFNEIPATTARPAHPWGYADYRSAKDRSGLFQNSWGAPDDAVIGDLRQFGFDIPQDACDLAQTNPAVTWLATPALVKMGQLLPQLHG